MKLGIIQGRLSEPKEGFQECPVEWKREFDLLEELDFTFNLKINIKYLI